MADSSAAHLTDRGLLRLNGADVRRFLQGLVSNDVDRLAPGHPLYGALLTAQGKYLFDFILHQDGDAVLIDVEAARLDELRRRLALYRLRAAVEIEVAEDRAVVAGWGDSAFDEAPLDPRLDALGRRAVLPLEEARRLGPAGAAYERHRLAHGVPAPADLVPQRSLLLESNFEELHGVSFTKGCFVGQELTARTKHRALVRKRLLPVRLEGPASEPGTPILLGSREAGEMRSSLESRGMALLRLEHLGAGELRAGDTIVVPEVPAWLSLKLPATGRAAG